MNPEIDGGQQRGYRYDLGLFEGFGVELEYMIVDRDTLDVRPVCDALLDTVGGEEGEAQPDGEGSLLAWSNELALHVVEIKTAEPVASLDALAPNFQDHVQRINEILSPMNARLMPTGMHPWMDPFTQTQLWPHECGPIYQAFDRIFNCKGHGWSNLQSAHLNLPFADDEEFGKLHAAVRAVLPLLPALAASTPVMDAKRTGLLDNRVDVYSQNALRVPSVAGKIVPEPVFTRSVYEHGLLAGIYHDISPLDPEGVLQHEWLNARGAIARFMRGSIEVRLLDLQECPACDLAVLTLVAAAIRAVVEEQFVSIDELRQLPTDPLSAVLMRTTRQGEQAEVGYAPLLRALGMGGTSVTAGEVWASLAERLLPADHPARAPLAVITRHGTLATRILKAVGEEPTRPTLHLVYQRLADSLQQGKPFTPS